MSGVAKPTKRCARCHEFKSVDHFAWRRREKGQHDTYCRPCRSAYGKEHYAAHRQRYIDQAHLQKQRLARERGAFLIEFFRTHPCSDCGERDPVVLEFDHIGHKSFGISGAVRGRNWQSVLDEIAKCEVVCANCHRRRTARRGRFTRALLADAANTATRT